MKGENDSTGYGQLEELKKFCEERRIKIVKRNDFDFGLGENIWYSDLGKTLYIKISATNEDILAAIKQINSD